MYPYPTDTIEIQQIIENLDSKSSSGIDEISNITVKAAGPVICEHLVFHINKSLNDGIFPSLLKLAKVVPLPKTVLKKVFIIIVQSLSYLFGVKSLNLLFLTGFLTILRNIHTSMKANLDSVKSIAQLMQ